MKFNKFIKECHQKEVFKKLSLYVVTSWVIIQVFATIWEPLGLPKESVTLLLILLLLGFPINVYLVWRLDLVKHEKVKPKINKHGKEVPGKFVKSPFRKAYFSSLMIISILFLAIVAIVIQRNFMTTVSFEHLEVSDKIAVEVFGNNTGDPKNDIIGKMASDWIIHGISENNIGQVISQKTIDDYSNIVMANMGPSKSENLLKDYFKPGKIIQGNFFQKDDKFLFQGSLIDAKKDDEQISFKLIECNSDNPLDCIEQLKQLILGYLVMDDNELLNLETTPPKFDAYQHVITARANVKDNDFYISEIEKAIAADPDYFEPKLLELVFYYNRQDYHKSDSLLQQIKPDANTSDRQKNILNMYNSLLKGDNRNVFRYIIKEYDANPYDLESSQSVMVVALQFINRPELVDGYFDLIPNDELIIENCLWCEYRNYVKAMSDIELERYESAIKLLLETISKVDAFYLNKPLAAAYIRSNQLDEFNEFITNVELNAEKDALSELYFFIGSEFLMQDNQEMADAYFNKIVLNEEEQDRSLMAESFYFLGDYKKAEAIFQKLYDENPQDMNSISGLASCMAKNGKTDQGAEMIKEMEGLRKDYQYGKIDYLIAEYYAAAADEKNVYKYLLKSISQGNNYTIAEFQNNPHFINYSKSKKFESIMNYWQ